MCVCVCVCLLLNKYNTDKEHVVLIRIDDIQIFSSVYL